MMWLIVGHLTVCILAVISWAVVVVAASTASFCFDLLTIQQAKNLRAGHDAG